MAEQVFNVTLANFLVEVTADNDNAATLLTNLVNQINDETDPSQVLASVGAVGGVSRVVIKNPENNEVIIHSSLFTPDE